MLSQKCPRIWVVHVPAKQRQTPEWETLARNLNMPMYQQTN